jgi:hypothetical protein
MPQQLAWDDKTPQQQAQPAQANRFDWGDEQSTAPPPGSPSAAPAQSPTYVQGAMERGKNYLVGLRDAIAHISAPGIAESILEKKAPNSPITRMLSGYPHANLNDLPGEMVINTLPMMVGASAAAETRAVPETSEPFVPRKMPPLRPDEDPLLARLVRKSERPNGPIRGPGPILNAPPQTPESVTPPMGPAAEAPIIPRIMQEPPAPRAPRYPTGQTMRAGLERVNSITEMPRQPSIPANLNSRMSDFMNQAGTELSNIPSDLASEEPPPKGTTIPQTSEETESALKRSLAKVKKKSATPN